MARLLSEIKEPGTFIIANIHGSETTRLMEMGIIPGHHLEFLRRAPMGYPIEIKVQDMLLTLRKPEAQSIEVEG